jgi:nitrate/nitrite transport system substrate-binding protein
MSRRLPFFAVIAATCLVWSSNALGVPTDPTTSPKPATEQLDVEKDELKFGFIKLTDCAPIVIAKEKGFFEDEGLQVERSGA